jgi:hypothetical protein
MSSRELIDIEYDELKHETDMAYLVIIDGDEVWIPKSVCELDEDNQIIEVQEWFAEKEGLI